VAEYFEFVVPGQFAARRPSPTGLNQFQPPALAITANRGTPARVIRGWLGKRAVA
jgi:hypothetical protein